MKVNILISTIDEGIERVSKVLLESMLAVDISYFIPIHLKIISRYEGT